MFVTPLRAGSSGGGGGGSGTVTSVGLIAPVELTVSGSPIIAAGDITLDWATQNANILFAGPATGSPDVPSFRSLVTADLANSIVTKAKIENVTTSKLLGRGDSGAGAPEEITLGSGLTMTGTTISASGSGATTFLGLTDTPSAYTSQAGKLVRVNSTPDALEFVTLVPVANGGLGIALSAPGADRILFWDHSSLAYDYLTAGTGLTITGTTIAATATGDVTGPGSATNNRIAVFNGTSGKIIKQDVFLGVNGGVITAGELDALILGTGSASGNIRIDPSASLVQMGVNGSGTNVGLRLYSRGTGEVQLNQAQTSVRAKVNTSGEFVHYTDTNVQSQVNDATGLNLNLNKSRSPTQDAHVIVQASDVLGNIVFRGSNGTSFVNAAKIHAIIDGTPGATNDMPGALLFSTTPDGSGTLAERMRINNTGVLSYGTTASSIASSAGLTPLIIISASGISSIVNQIRHTSPGGGGAVYQLSATRGTDANSYTILQNNDGIGTFNFLGADGTQYVPAAQIIAQVDGVPGVNDMPGRLIFATTSDGAATSVERMRIDNTGLVTLAAGQIKFPATQNPSSDVNTLDDYEEGTFTPGIAFGGGTTGITYAVQVGTYTKIGDMVHIQGRCLLSAKGSSAGAMTVTGLPFANNSTSNNFSAAALRANGFTGIAGHLNAYIGPSATVFTLGYLGTGTSTDLSNTTATDNSDIIFGAEYKT